MVPGPHIIIKEGTRSPNNSQTIRVDDNQKQKRELFRGEKNRYQTVNNTSNSNRVQVHIQIGKNLS